ncbi:PASTA domain-containing protein [Actinoplanes lobatus]|nr:PASTA domain-containing protein [Actinoplanes lobatus]MBB4751992.1 beta-lactam-binding protein with PASTA domain [Actinoplanes lobatus]
MSVIKTAVAAAAAAATMFSMAACTPKTDDTPEAAGSPITASASAEASPTQKAPSQKSTTKKSPTKKASTPSAASKVKVPNGVGMDYQSAQDLWRAAGLHVAPATDATGAHRLPLIDANWVVLAQDLKAGKKVPSDSFITATVKKYSDD